jgi:trimeric autotransporter adhesin
MVRIAVITATLFLGTLAGFSQTVGDYQTTNTGSTTWTASTNWQRYDGSTWVATTAPTGAEGTTITIRRSMATSTSTSALLNITGTLVINPGVTLTISNPATSSTADFTIASSGSVINNGIIAFALGSPSNQTRFEVNGTLTNNNTFTANTNTVTTVNGVFKNAGTITSTVTRLIFNSGSTYEHLFTTSAGTIPEAGWNTNSTCLISGYTTNATAPQRINSAFGNFTWNTPNLTTNIDLGGVLTSVAGTLSVTSTGTGTLLFGSAEMTIGGDLICTGNVDASSASLVFNSLSAVQSISGTVNPYNIFVDNSVGVNIEGNVSVAGSISLTDGDDIFDADGASNSGVLTLLSTADNPAVDASITAIPSGATFQGNVTVQRYMSGEGYRMYRYISSPVTNATVANWQDDFSITGAFTGYSTRDPSNNSSIVCGYRLGTSASMFTYNEATQAYAAYPTTSSSAALVPGVGYSALVRNCSSPTIIDVRGPINQGEITPTITYTTSGSNSAMYGYNLIGNPYPSALDWESPSWTMSNISSVMAISDNSTGSLVYHYYDKSELTGDEFIAVGQAFWVRATAAAPSLTFTEEVKAAPGSSYSFFRTAKPVLDRLTITVTNGSITDKAFVKVNPAAKSSLDNFDGPKMDNTLFDISTLSSENIPMAINAVEQITCGSAVKINLKDFTAGSYKMNFQGAGLVQEYEMVLTDKYTGSVTNVTASPDYTFVVDNNTASKAADRFELTFKEKAMSLGLSVDTNVSLCATESGKVKVYNPQANISYFATLRGELVSDTLAGGSSSIEFNIPAALLAEGENTVYIHAVGNCDNVSQLEQSSLVKKYSAASITQVNGRTLQSNYATGNQWYLNGQLLADTSAVLRVSEEGEYQLNVATGSCTLSATYALGAETFMDKIAAYPNPVESMFSIELPIEQCAVSELPIMNDVGRQVGIVKLKDYGTYRTGQYDFSATPTGLYLIRIESGTGVRHLKVVKK